MGSGRSLKELAKHLGLSQTTVSRVINNSGSTHRISAATQKRVLAAAAEMNYKASPLARGLRSRRSQTIGVMVPEISGGYSAAVLSGIEDVLLISGFFYFVVSHHHREELLRDYPALLLSRAVEGIIAVDSALDVELPVPIVAVSGHLRSPSSICSGWVTVRSRLSRGRVSVQTRRSAGRRSQRLLPSSRSRLSRTW